MIKLPTMMYLSTPPRLPSLALQKTNEGRPAPAWQDSTRGKGTGTDRLPECEYSGIVAASITE